jgi:hypothetical protein
VTLPPYWSALSVKGPGRQPKFGSGERVVIDAGSSTFKEITKLIASSWDASHVGHGNDAVGLNHSAIEVRRVWRIENARLYHKYRSKRKELCLFAARNKLCPPIKGLNGENEVMTRCLGEFMCFLISVLCVEFYVKPTKAA